MLFLDHVEDLYVADFQICAGLGLLRKEALAVADNVVRPGAPEYRQFVRGDPSLESWGVRGLIMPGEFEVRDIFFSSPSLLFSFSSCFALISGRENICVVLLTLCDLG